MNIICYNQYVKIVFWRLKTGGVIMATESITHHFCFEGEAAVRFANAIEESLNSPKKPLSVHATELHGEELKEFIRRTIKANAK